MAKSIELKKKYTEADIVCDVIGERSFQAAADWFNEMLSEQFQITRQSVYNWAVGINEPNHQFVKALVIFYAEGDERREMGEKLIEMRDESMKKSAHWVGKDQQLAISGQLSEADGKKLLKAIKVRS
jgi:hypothetical protein